MARMVLDREQNQVLSEALAEAQNFGATAREKKALTEALIVESNIRNLNYGDRDSLGPLQQRPQAGWKHPRNVRLAVRDFLIHARGQSGTRGSAGKLAQSVQRSAFPGRYDAVASEASQLLAQHGGGSSYVQHGKSALSNALPSGPTLQTRVVDDPEAKRRVALANYLQMSNPHSLLLRLGVVDPNEPTTRTEKIAISGNPGKGNQQVPNISGNYGHTGKLSTPVSHLQGVADFEGTKVAAWIKPVLEYARKRGWRGQVNSGWRSLADQTRIYNSGVRPAAKPGTSNHEFTQFPGGAIDASDAEVLSHILKTSPYSKLLVWAGEKDRVHFSHPHGGSY